MFGAEEAANEASEAPADNKLPLDGKARAAYPSEASPASTAAPEGSPAASSPGTTLSSGLVLRNTFLTTPIGRPGSLDGFFEEREVHSCPTSPLGAPPGLADRKDGKETKPKMLDEAALEEEEEAEEHIPKVSPLASPADESTVQPMLWPRTMSGEDLRELLAAAADAMRSKEQASASGQAAGAESAEDHIPKQPTYWPRTNSGDDLEAILNSIKEASPPHKSPTAASASDVQKPTLWPRTISNEVGFAQFVDPNKQVEAEDSIPKPMLWPRTMSGDDLDFATAGLPAAKAPPPVKAPPRKAPAPPPPPPPTQAAPELKEQELPPPPKASAAAPDAKVVSIADFLPAEPELGSPEMPTIGSRGHRLGNCKPCAFLHTKGCKNDVECPFCHLCERGEKKRRQREKWQAQRQQEQAAAAAMAAAVVMPPLLAVPPPMHLPLMSTPLMVPPPMGMAYGGCAPLATMPM